MQKKKISFKQKVAGFKPLNLCRKSHLFQTNLGEMHLVQTNFHDICVCVHKRHSTVTTMQQTKLPGEILSFVCNVPHWQRTVLNLHAKFSSCACRMPLSLSLFGRVTSGSRSGIVKTLSRCLRRQCSTSSLLKCAGPPAHKLVQMQQRVVGFSKVRERKPLVAL